MSKKLIQIDHVSLSILKQKIVGQCIAAYWEAEEIEMFMDQLLMAMDIDPEPAQHKTAEIIPIKENGDE